MKFLKDTMIVESKRLILRRFKLGDLNTLMKYRNDPIGTKYEGWEKLLSKEKGRKFIIEMQDIDLNTVDNWVQIAFEYKARSLHIGDCGIRRFDTGRQAEVGIRIDREYWRKGFAYEGLSAIFSHLFTNFGLHRIIAIADIRNIGSISLLTKLGMRKEGRSIESFLDKGVWTDEYHFAILKKEWERKYNMQDFIR